MISRRRFTAGGGMALLAGAAVTATGLLAVGRGEGDGADDAFAAWSGPATATDPRLRLIGWACLAPSSHNLQPWRVRLDGDDRLSLFADPTRLHTATDPDLRQTTISLGGFLELLLLAAEATGLRAALTLFPRGPYTTAAEMADHLVAEIVLRPDPDAPVDPLFSAVLERRTTRLPFAPRAIGAATREALLGALPSGLGVAVGWVEAGAPVEQVRGLVLAGVQTEMSNRAALAELAGIMRLSPAEVAAHRDGLVPLSGIAAWAVRTLFGQQAFADPDSMVVRAGVRQMEQAAENTPAFLWLTTNANDRAAQVAAGRAYLRLDLAAARRRLAIQPCSQPLQEYPAMADTRALLHRLLARPGQTVQMLARVGYAPERPPHSPRRAVADLIA